MRFRIESGTLRATSVRARADEWEKITGASDTRIASSMVSIEVWDRSTSIPSRFISRTTSSPNAREAAVLPGHRLGVRPVEGDVVGEGHVPRAEVVVRAQRPQGVLEDVAALHADERRHLALLELAHHVVGGEGEGEAIGVAGDQPPGDVDLLELQPRVSLLARLARDVDRPELRAHVARGQPREIGLARGARPQVVGGDIVGRLDVVADLPGEVVVAVDERGGGQDAPGAAQGGVVGGAGGDGQGEDEGGEDQGLHGVHANSGVLRIMELPAGADRLSM